MKTCINKEWLSDENNKFFLILLGICVTLTLFWLVIIQYFVPPLPIYDEWKTLVPCSEFNILSWFTDGGHHEQKSLIGSIANVFATNTHLGYWRLPYWGVLFNGMVSVIIISIIRQIRGLSRFSDIIIPLALFHTSLVFGYFRPDMMCFAVLIGTASIAMTLIAIPAERTKPWQQWVIGLCLILLSVNTSTGVVYAAFLGGIYFLKNLFTLRKENYKILIPVVLLTGLAALSSLSYVLSVRCAAFTVSGMHASTFADKFECAITGIGAALGELGIVLRWKSGAVILTFVFLTLVAIFQQYKKSAITLVTAFTLAGLLITCLVSPVIIGITRGGWSDVALRHMFILMQFPVAFCLCWIVLESGSGLTKYLRAIFFGLFIISILYSCPTVGRLGIEKLTLYNKLMADIEQGIPLEFVASRNSYGLSMYNANILESHMRRFEELKVRPFNDVKPFVYDSQFQLSVPDCILAHNANLDKVTGCYTGQKSSGTYLELRLPEKQYVKAVQIEFSMSADFTEKESVPRCSVSSLSRGKEGDVIAYEQCTLITLCDTVNKLNVWVDTEIDSILFKPDIDNFSVKIKSITVFK